MQLFSVCYFPNIFTLSLLLKSPDIFIEVHENFIKQTFRSRCTVLGPNDILTLSVPVRDGRKNVPIREIQIDNTQRWRDNHWRSICAAYAKAPFFEHYEEFVKKVIYNSHELLFDHSLESMHCMFALLQKQFNPQLTDEFVHQIPPPDEDYRALLNQKSDDAWSAKFTAIPYQQNFGKLFVPNLSALDVIFCEGPGASSILAKTAK